MIRGGMNMRRFTPPEWEALDHMAKYGVIDLGSNTIRLVVYEVGNDKQPAYSCKDFKRIVNEKEMAGLAAFVENGLFGNDGIDRAVGILKTLAKHAGYFNCKSLEVFATAVIRNANNRDDVMRTLRERTGLRVTLLSERDEAHLGFVGASCGKALTRGTLIDIGGGSTELSRIAGATDSADISIGQGSLSSFATCVSSILPTADEMDAVAETFRARLIQVGDLSPYRADILYGVGGSARAAAKIVAQVQRLASKPRTVSTADIAQVLDACRAGNASFAHCVLKASAERVHTMIPGCIIIDELFRALGANRLEICKYGVREGYLIERVLRARAIPPAATAKQC